MEDEMFMACMKHEIMGLVAHDNVKKNKASKIDITTVRKCHKNIAKIMQNIAKIPPQNARAQQ
jgi:hypothetical protein